MNFKYTINKVWFSSTQRVISLTFIGMLLGLLMDVMLAAKLGTTETTDSLIIALSLPLLIDTVVREGTKSSMIPLFMEKQVNLKQQDFQRFTSGLLNLSLIIGISLTVIVEVIAFWIIFVLGLGLSPVAKTEATFLLRACAPLIVFAPAITVLSAILNSQKRFSIVALRNAIAPGIAILILLLGWQQENISHWLAIAYSIGFAGFFLILLVEGKRAGFQYNWLVFPSKESLSQLWSAASLPTTGFILMQGLRLIERFFASLVAVGGVATYYFAFRIFSAIQTLIGVSIATTGLPKMTEHNLAGNKSQLANAIGKSFVRTLLLTLPVLIIVLFGHKLIIASIYGHGVFNSNSIQNTAQVFFWLGLGLVFNCITPVLQSGLYAQKRYDLVFRDMFILAIVNVSLAWILSQFYGLIGIASAVSISVMLSVINLVYLIHKTGVPLIKEK